jgi:hypothetical protein
MRYGDCVKENEMSDYQFYKKGGLKIRIDYHRPGLSIDYKIEDDEWEASCYQTADMYHLRVSQVWAEINEWLEGQS